VGVLVTAHRLSTVCQRRTLLVSVVVVGTNGIRNGRTVSVFHQQLGCVCVLLTRLDKWARNVEGSYSTVRRSL
jgi:hypothetical protein